MHPRSHSWPRSILRPIVRFARWGLAIASALMLLGFAATLTRVPAPRNESQLYASIALAQHLAGNGVPTVLSSPSAVDHIPFYGPVYFYLQAAIFKLFGVSIASSRLLSLAGALLIALGGALLARQLSQSPDRALLSFTLLLLTPEIGASATRGDMQSLAVGFEIISLAMFVAQRSVACGGFLALAALTTPRTYPFVVAFVASGTACYVLRRQPDPDRRRFLTATAVAMACLILWATWSFGSPLHWARFMALVLTREDTDVALAQAAIRWWQFSWSLIITPLFAVAGLAAIFVRRGATAGTASAGAAMFVLTTSALAGVLTFAGMNLTFLWGGYFALPLFAVVLALPYRELPNRAKVLALAVCMLAVCDLGAAALKNARIAATWAARDPKPIDALVRAHVPRGAVVFGPSGLYFFSVEGNGARYLSVSEQSAADWTRWVAADYPRSELKTDPWRMRSSAERFLLWPVMEETDLPDRYDCVRGHLVASHRPPAHHLARLGSFGEVLDAGYPETELYKLPRGCPAGVE
jgi:hypothetical protein